MQHIARWETRGKDWLDLYSTQSERFGTVYSYKGNGCGGGLPLTVKTDEDAIKWMDNPWGHPDGTGQCTVLRSDRSSLHRVV